MAYETNALGLDLSHWDSLVDFAALKGVIDFVTLKAGGTDGGELYLDDKFTARVQAAYDNGIPAGAYWFAGPSYWLQRQYTMAGVESLTDEQHPILQGVMQALKNKAIYWLAIDIEDNSLKTSAGQVTDTWLAFYCRDLVERIQRQQAKGNLRQFKLGVYSRKSFVTGFPALEAYLGAQPGLFLWPANWYTGTGGLLTHNTRPSAKPITFGWSSARPQEWTFWQWAGDSGAKYTHPAVKTVLGVMRPLDVNLYNGTLAQLKAWAGIAAAEPTPTPTPAPEPSPVDLTAVSAKLDAILAHLDKLSWLEK